MSFYLSKRNQFYYFRIRIPKDVRHYFSCNEIKLSLHTRDSASAKILHSHFHSKTQKAFAILRTQSLSGDEIQALVRSITKPNTHQDNTSSGRSSLRFSKLINLYSADREPHWSKRTKKEFSSILEILLWVMSDKPIDKFTRSDFIHCRDRLKNLPSNLQKRVYDYSDKDLLNGNHPLPTLTNKTVNKYLVLLSSLFKWAVKHGYVSNNLAEGLSLPLHVQARNERKTYETSDLERLVSALPRDKDRPERFWIPLVALYSGMRLNEICQLHVDDIHEVDGIMCFNVNCKGQKRLKSKSSQRIIPVHPKLIQMGVLDLIEGMDHESPLWTNLKPNQYGSWGKKFGNWYSRFNRKYITNDPQKCFHSFRHTFADRLKQSGVDEHVLSDLLGHSDRSLAFGRYGKRMNVQSLYDTVCTLNYCVVDNRIDVP